jgi:phage shock protein A
MALFKAFKSLLRAKDRQAADKIESGNVVEFAKNDMEDMQHDLRTVQENVGHIKARIAGLNDDMKVIQEQIDNDTTKAEALMAKGNEDLAQKLCAEVETLTLKLTINKQALDQQNALLKQHEESKSTLEDNIRQCENDLEIMKTQKEVTDANQTLVKVDAGASGSAVQKFAERRKKLNEQLRVSAAMVEETKAPESLSKQADKALGTSPGSALFAKLKAKSAPAATPPPAPAA